MHTDSDTFLSGVVSLLEARKEKGSVTVTFKRSNLQHGKKAGTTEAEYVCVARATDLKKKHGTTISAREQARFGDAFSTILRAHASSLKRRARPDKAKPAKR